MARCRLCTSNDREALIDEMAGGAWEMAGYGGKWEDVHATWRTGFRYHAELMLRVLERDHDHGSDAARV
jgi:hypothetical protein